MDIAKKYEVVVAARDAALAREAALREELANTQELSGLNAKLALDLQQRLTVAEQRTDELLAFLAKIENNGLNGFNIDTGITVRDELRSILYCLSIPKYEMKCITNPTSRLNTYKGEK